MGGVRIVAIDRLRTHLRAALGGDSLVFRRLDRALASHDPDRLEAALDALALYPDKLRQPVEEALLTWLLEGGEPLPSAGTGRRGSP